MINNPSEKLDCILTYGFKNLTNDEYQNFRINIYELLEFFGVRMLKKDFGPFKHGDMIYIVQDENGAWIYDFDTNQNRACEIDYDVSPEQLFY